MNVEIRHLRQFLAVAEELHFSRAADRLHLAQPALSANIRKLEESLQLRLFERSTRTVELTHEGRVLAKQAKPAVEAYDHVLEAASRLRGGGSGPVTLGVYTAVGSELKRAILEHLRGLNPDVELTIVAESTVKLVESVRTGQLDAALCLAPLGLGDLRRLLVSEQPLVAALPAWHPLAGRDAVRLVELRDDSWIIPSNRRFREDSFLHRLCNDAGFEMQVADAVSDFDDTFAGVAAGLGIEVVPAEFINRQLPDEVVIVPIDEIVLPIYLVTRGEDRSPALAALTQAVFETARTIATCERSVAPNGRFPSTPASLLSFT